MTLGSMAETFALDNGGADSMQTFNSPQFCKFVCRLLPDISNTAGKNVHANKGSLSINSLRDWQVVPGVVSLLLLSVTDS